MHFDDKKNHKSYDKKKKIKKKRKKLKGPIENPIDLSIHSYFAYSYDGCVSGISSSITSKKWITHSLQFL